MSISNAYDMGLLSRTLQVNNIFKVYLYICTHNKPSRFIFSNSNIRHVIASLVFQSRTATIQIQKNRGAIEIRFVSVSSHIPGYSLPLFYVPTMASEIIKQFVRNKGHKSSEITLSEFF